MNTSPDLPPIPRDDAERRRCEETRRRRRMLYGLWRPDLLAYIRSRVPHVRQEAWGVPDISSCVLQASVGALAVLYDRTPVVTHDDPSAAPLIKMVGESGLWSLMQQVQRDTLGLREMLVRVGCELDEIGVPKLIYKPVSPDMVIATPSQSEPERPVEIKLAAQHRHPATGRVEYVWEVWRADSFEIRRTEDGPDVSAEYMPRAEGAPSNSFGALPFVVYHARRTGCLWDPYALQELVEGSLNCAMKWTFFDHGYFNASHPQRWTVNARIPADIEGDERRDSVVTDPITVVMFEASDGDGQPMIGQWQPGADPEKMFDAAAGSERRVAAYAGISPADVQRVAGDPRSGFAIALNREAQREAQRRFEPVFRPSDEELLAVTARVVNAVAGTNYPTSGYRVAYVGLPPSPEERKAERDHLLELLREGLADPVDVYRQLNPTLAHLEDAAIEQRLAQNAMRRRQFAGA